jgi:hypothetical protein
MDSDNSNTKHGIFLKLPYPMPVKLKKSDITMTVKVANSSNLSNIFKKEQQFKDSQKNDEFRGNTKKAFWVYNKCQEAT